MVDIRNSRKASLLIAIALALILTTAMPSASAQPVIDGDPSTDDERRHQCLYGGMNADTYVADLRKDNVHYEGVVYVACAGIMTTDAEGNFRVNEPVTRADAASASVRMLRHRTGTPFGCKPGHPQHPYGDVDGSTPQHRDIADAWCLGIMQGVTYDQFHPYDTLTRAQAASVVVRTLDQIWTTVYGTTWTGSKPDCIDLQSFKDMDPYSPHYSAINALACNGVVQGVDHEHYHPQGMVTRGQLASVLLAAHLQQRDSDIRNWKECCVQ